MKKTFACYSCGACCHFIHLEDGHAHFKHPEFDHCKHLTKDNKCAIYDTRPDICRVDKQYDLQFSTDEYWEEYCEISLKACKILEDKVNGKNSKKRT